MYGRFDYRVLLGNVLLGNRLESLEGYFAKPQRDSSYGGSVNFGFSVTLKHANLASGAGQANHVPIQICLTS